MDFQFIKTILKRIGNFWWGLSKEQRKSIASLFEKLAVAGFVPALITPMINGKEDSFSWVLFMSIYAIVFQTLAVLALIDKE